MALCLLLVFAGWLFSRPAETVLVMDDAGVYLLNGIHLARNGSLFHVDKDLARFPEEAYSELLTFVRSTNEYIRFPGAFHIRNTSQGIVQASFFHLFPIWIALFYGLFGMSGAFFTTPFFGLLALLGVFSLGRQVFGSSVAILATFLLTINFSQIWFARYSTSEMATQALLWGSLFCLALFWKTNQSYPALLAGIGMGQLFFTRVDTFPAIGLVTLIVLIRYLAYGTSSKEIRWFLWPVSLVFFHGLVHAALFASGYVISLWSFQASPARLTRIVLGLSILAAAIAATWIWRQPVAGKLRDLWQDRKWVTAAGICAPVIVGLVFLPDELAYWKQMYLASTLQPSFSTVSPVIWLNWYLTPLGLFLGIAGAALLWLRKPAGILLPFLGILGLYVLLYLPNAAVTPLQPWAIRRFLPEVIPALLLTASYGLLSWKRTEPRILSLGWLFFRLCVAALLAVMFLKTSQPIFTHLENHGAWSQLQALAGKFAPGSILLFPRSAVADNLPQPLTVLFSQTVLVLQSENPKEPLLAKLVEQWHSEKRSVYLINPTPSFPLKDYSCIAETPFHWNMPRLERTYDHFPIQVESWAPSLQICRLVPVAQAFGPLSEENPFLLNLGEKDQASIIEGFHDREVLAGGLSYRWTKDLCRIRIPAMVAGKEAELSLLLAGGRPAGAPPAAVTVYFDQARIGQFQAANDMTAYRFHLAPRPDVSENGVSELRLETNTWNPMRQSHSQDARNLGVMLAQVRVQLINTKVQNSQKP